MIPRFQVVSAAKGMVYDGSSSHNAYRVMNECINERSHVVLKRNGSMQEEFIPPVRREIKEARFTNPLRIQIEYALKAYGQVSVLNDRWVDALFVCMDTWSHGHLFTDETGEYSDLFTVNVKWDRRAGNVSVVIYQEFTNDKV